MPNKTDLIGKRFGRLLVLQETQERRNGNVVWLCQCDCGTVKKVNGDPLRRGQSLSCGCLQREKAAKSGKFSAKHGMTYSPTWKSWSEMKVRCLNPSSKIYQYYGGRGIKVCHHFLENFANFLEDMGERPDRTSLDRIDNNGHYSCGHCEECIREGWTANCRWASSAQQNRNKRSNVNITFNGETLCLAEWAEKLGIGYKILHHRYQRGWSADRIVSTPVATKHTITFNGETLTLAEWAARAGITYQALHARLSRGQSLEQILGLSRERPPV